MLRYKSYFDGCDKLFALVCILNSEKIVPYIVQSITSDAYRMYIDYSSIDLSTLISIYKGSILLMKLDESESRSIYHMLVLSMTHAIIYQSVYPYKFLMM